MENDTKLTHYKDELVELAISLNLYQSQIEKIKNADESDLKYLEKMYNKIDEYKSNPRDFVEAIIWWLDR